MILERMKMILILKTSIVAPVLSCLYEGTSAVMTVFYVINSKRLASHTQHMESVLTLTNHDMWKQFIGLQQINWMI